jgi:hypothetical protein
MDIALSRLVPLERFDAALVFTRARAWKIDLFGSAAGVSLHTSSHKIQQHWHDDQQQQYDYQQSHLDPPDPSTKGTPAWITANDRPGQ